MKIIVAGRELEVSDEVIAKAIEEKTSVTVETPDLVVRTTTEEESFVSNLKNGVQGTAYELARKELFKEMDLDFEGTGAHKSIDKSKEFLKSHIAKAKEQALLDAKIEPEKKVAELQKDLETLKGTITTLTTEKESISKQFHSYKSESVINNTLLSVIPENVSLPKDDMLLILKNRMSFQLDETNRINVLGQDGQVMKNPTTLDPLDAKAVVTDFFNQNPTYLKGAGGGGGGSDEPGADGKMTIEQFIAKKEKEGILSGSEAFNTELQSLMKDGKISG